MAYSLTKDVFKKSSSDTKRIISSKKEAFELMYCNCVRLGASPYAKTAIQALCLFLIANTPLNKIPKGKDVGDALREIHRFTGRTEILRLLDGIEKRRVLSGGLGM